MTAHPNNLEQLVEKWAPSLRTAFLEAISLIRSRVRIAQIVDRLEKGDIDGAILAVGIDPVVFRPVDLALMHAFEAGGNFAAKAVPPSPVPGGFKLQVLFDVRNPRAEAWLKNYSSDLVTEIVADQKEAIRTHLTAGMTAGNNPRTVALDLVGKISPVTGKREGGVIGLTSSQEQWALNYGREIAANDPAALTRNLRDKRFDSAMSKAIKFGKPIPQDLQDKMLASYRNRALKFRADTIARTEALTSLHQAQHEATQQGIDKGAVKIENVTKIWHSAGDSRVRDTHRALNGTKVKFSADFVSPSGARLRFPGDPNAPASETVNCRCYMAVSINHFAGVK